MRTVIEAFTALGAHVRQEPRSKLICLNRTLTVRVVVTRCQSAPRRNRWSQQISIPHEQDALLLARLAPDNKAILDYFCFPPMAQRPHYTFGTRNLRGFAPHQFTDLAFLGVLVAASQRRDLEDHLRTGRSFTSLVNGTANADG